MHPDTRSRADLSAQGWADLQWVVNRIGDGRIEGPVWLPMGQYQITLTRADSSHVWIYRKTADGVAEEARRFLVDAIRRRA